MRDEHFKFHQAVWGHYSRVTENYIYNFAADLFRKLRIKLLQNYLDFIEDITKTWWSLVSGHSVDCRR